MVVRVLQWMSAHQVAHPTSYRKLTMRTVVLKQGRETARGDDKSTLSPSSGIQLPWGQTREEWGGEASPMHPCLTMAILPPEQGGSTTSTHRIQQTSSHGLSTTRRCEEAAQRDVGPGRALHSHPHPLLFPPLF